MSQSHVSSWCAWDVIVTHICHNSLADAVQMFSSALLATHESEQLEEEEKDKTALRDFPCCHEGTVHASAERLDTLQEVPVPGVPHWRWQSEQRAPQGHCSSPALRALPPTTDHVAFTEVRREGETPLGCLDHKSTAINSCRCFSPTPIYHQHRTKYDGHFLSSVWVHGNGSRDKTQVHLK